MYSSKRVSKTFEKVADVSQPNCLSIGVSPIRLKPTKATTSPCLFFAGDHVTDDAGTGFVHTAPGHGREDFEVWTANARALRSARHQHGDPLHRR